MNLSEGTADMNADGKSDDSIVLTTRSNKAATAVAESVEERESPKGTVVDRHRRTGHRAGYCVIGMTRHRRLVANLVS